MERSKDYSALSQAVSAHLTRGVRCNGLITEAQFGPLVQEGTVYVHETPAALLLLQDRGSHHRLHFFLHDLEAPLPMPVLPVPTVVEVPFRPRDTGLQEAITYLENQGFRRLFTRQRFARSAGAGDLPDNQVIPAGPQDRDRVQALLLESFSALTGCLPNDRELSEDLNAGRVLLLEEGGKLAGLLHYSLDAKTSEIRHLAVRREARGKGLTRPLIARYLTETADKKSLVWAREGYQAAQAAYTAMGFAPDGWRSAVLCWEGP